MRKKVFFFGTYFTVLSLPYYAPLHSVETNHAQPVPPSEVAPHLNAKPFHAFTGKIKKNKVRLRTQPNLDAPILRELNKDETFVIVGETGEFYAVQPPKGTKAYVFRTFVLDNVVEGSRVNIRLEPDLEAPVIAQLNTGDRIDGTVSAKNNKWLEITPPVSTRFYVAKDLVDNIGAPDMLAKLEKRTTEAQLVLEASTQRVQAEIAKPFEEMQVDAIVGNLNQLIQKNPDLPALQQSAREQLKIIQENHLQKKIAYLETQAKQSSETLKATNQQLKKEIDTQQEKLALLEQELKKHAEVTFAAAVAAAKTEAPEEICMTTPEETTNGIASLSAWEEAELDLFQKWASTQDQETTPSDFYREQLPLVVSLKGVVDVYQKPLKNKPGDYLLINRYNNLPMAYLYSTKINLQNFIGREVTLQALPRDNHNYAFPAYYIVSVE